MIDLETYCRINAALQRQQPNYTQAARTMATARTNRRRNGARRVAPACQRCLSNRSALGRLHPARWPLIAGSKAGAAPTSA